jgi:GT2 family glycosyltransferase
MATNSEPLVSVVICTSGRPSTLANALESLAANTFQCFEILVIDQSTDWETEKLVSSRYADDRIRYIRSTTKGTGAGRSEGLKLARADIVAITDDDCVLPPDWVEKMYRVYDNEPGIAACYCQVDAAPYNRSLGYIPDYQVPHDVTWHNLNECTSRFGLGAGMSVRRSTALSIGGFDQNLGPGSKFQTADDIDVAIRLMIKGYPVHLTNTTRVIHNGFRSWQQGRKHSLRHIGLGAVYVKPLLCGYRSAARYFPFGSNRSSFSSPEEGLAVSCSYSCIWRG